MTRGWTAVFHSKCVTNWGWFFVVGQKSNQNLNNMQSLFFNRLHFNVISVILFKNGCANRTLKQYLWLIESLLHLPDNSWWLGVFFSPQNDREQKPMKRSQLASFPVSDLFPPRTRAVENWVLSWGWREDGITSPSGSGCGPSENRSAALESLSLRGLVAPWVTQVQGKVRRYLQFKQEQTFEGIQGHPKQRSFLLYSWNTLQFSGLVSKVCGQPWTSPTAYCTGKHAVCTVLEAKNERYPKFYLFKKGVARIMII